jgi:hypothetical protein
MSTALVLSDRGAGLTTFVGLLYTAQVRLGTEDSDEFRFSADRESIRRVGDIYGSLGDGRFPEADADWEQHPLSFVFGFKRGRLSSIARREGMDEAGFDTVRVQLGGIPAADVAELNRNDAVLEPGTRRLLRSQIVLPLVDASWLSAEPTEIGGLPMARYDELLASTLALLGKFLTAESEKRARRMYPLFIVTKFDRASSEALRRLHAPAGSTEGWSASQRAGVGKGILENYLPKTGAFLLGKGESAVQHDPPMWFFSSLRTEERAGETRIARRERPPLGGWEPEYPFDEYHSLLLRMGEIVHRLPVEVEF